MAIVFHSRNDVLVRTRDGRNCVVQENIDIVEDSGAVYRVPVGAETDGASIPQILWTAGLTPFGTYWLACVVHDAAYRNTLLRQMTNGEWAVANLSKPQCDTLLLDCMIALEVSEAERDEIYEGVHFAAWKAFREDRGE